MSKRPDFEEIEKALKEALDLVDDCRPLSEEEVLRIVIPVTFNLVRDAFFAGVEQEEAQQALLDLFGWTN